VRTSAACVVCATPVAPGRRRRGCRFPRPSRLDRALFHKLASGKWARDHHHRVVGGPTGIGPSWLACALGRKACRILRHAHRIGLNGPSLRRRRVAAESTAASAAAPPIAHGGPPRLPARVAQCPISGEAARSAATITPGLAAPDPGHHDHCNRSSPASGPNGPSPSPECVARPWR